METLIDDSPPIASVETPPPPPPPLPMSYPEASTYPAAQEPANSTRSRPVWVWVLVAVLAVVLVCVCIGVIGSIFLF